MTIPVKACGRSIQPYNDIVPQEDTHIQTRCSLTDRCPSLDRPGPEDVFKGGDHSRRTSTAPQRDPARNQEFRPSLLVTSWSPYRYRYQPRPINSWSAL